MQRTVSKKFNIQGKLNMQLDKEKTNLCVIVLLFSRFFFLRRLLRGLLGSSPCTHATGRAFRHAWRTPLFLSELLSTYSPGNSRQICEAPAPLFLFSLFFFHVLKVCFRMVRAPNQTQQQNPGWGYVIWHGQPLEQRLKKAVTNDATRASTC